MEQTLIIKFYTSAGKRIQNMWIDPESSGEGMRFKVKNPEEAGAALQEYLELQNIELI